MCVRVGVQVVVLGWPLLGRSASSLGDFWVALHGVVPCDMSAHVFVGLLLAKGLGARDVHMRGARWNPKGPWKGTGAFGQVRCE